jgi:predicted AlkP superfamily phosphohydrolase/phosphomutase
LFKDDTGDNVFKYVINREDLYHGPFLNELYPDIIFELDKNYGVGWEIENPLFGKSFDHNIASGGHRKEAVFLMANVTRNIRTNKVSLVDVAPTVLDILGIDPTRYDFDGNSILE